MARHTYEFHVNDVRYEATTFAGRKGITNATKLMKLASPALSQAFSGLKMDEGTIESEWLGQG